MIGIIDYGVGNLHSIKNLLKKIGVSSLITNDPNDIESCNKLILPGVGAFDTAMYNYKHSGLEDVIYRKVFEQGTPILGICLGMQMMCISSEEGSEKGLGWIDAEIIRFNFNGIPNKSNLKIPHMGWNKVMPSNRENLFKGFDGEIRFYHVHSYYVKLKSEENCLAKTNFGFDFTSAFNKGNLYGVQFHPEKSHKFGMRLLKNFSEITC
jgi:glutamine amidotransferase